MQWAVSESEIILLSKYQMKYHIISLMSDSRIQYPYIILQTGNKNMKTNQVEVVVLILCRILITNLQGNV